MYISSVVVAFSCLVAFGQSRPAQTVQTSTCFDPIDCALVGVGFLAMRVDG